MEIPPDIACANDYRAYAKERLDDATWHYIDGGSGDELTKNANRTSFDAIKLRSRVLCDLSGATTQTTLFKQTLKYPMLVAPMAYQKLLHEHGEVGSVMASCAQDIGFILSTLASSTIEDIAHHHQANQPPPQKISQETPQEQSSPLWFGLYIQPDFNETLNLIKRAEESGYQALVISVDAPVNGLRNREQRANFSLPEHVSAVNLINSNNDDTNYEQYQHPVLTRIAKTAPTWQTVADIIKHTSLPVIIKGILDPQDAVMAKDIGAQGVIVSNHGGRVLDSSQASIEALPAIRTAVGEDFTLLLDSGINRGSDIFKAIALGANAVLIGRPVLYALATAGPMGVAHVLKILKDEFELTMGLCGTRNVEKITQDNVIFNTK